MAAEHYGDALRIERERQLLSQKKLATLAGVSRRHLASAERGANISIEVLRKLARALGITRVDVGEGLTLNIPEGKTLGILLAPFAAGFEQNARASLQLARELRGLSKARAASGAPGATQDDAPDVVSGSPETAQLAEQVFDFVRKMRSLTDPDEVRRLKRHVSDLLDTVNA
jgi:transcriptional regulator with XRE-family HTH domain